MCTHVLTRKILKLFDIYLQEYLFIKQINKSSTKKLRHRNFPEYISEYMVFRHLSKRFPEYQFKQSSAYDIVQLPRSKNECIKKIEVKCCSSNGPLSFGPVQSWDQLYIVDARNLQNDVFKIYKCTGDMTQVKVNKTDTFMDQCNQKRRPRICLNNLLQQESLLCECVYHGSMKQILF